MRRSLRLALFVIVGLLAGGTGYWLSAPDRPGAADAERILAASLPDLSKKPQAIGNWVGKVLVVNFWATWCAPCREEIPHFVRMQSRLGARGLQFIGVAIDNHDKVRSFAADFGINYPILVGQLDAMELSKLAGNKRGGLPYTLVLDRSGDVVSQHYGALSEETLEPIVEKLL